MTDHYHLDKDHSDAVEKIITSIMAAKDNVRETIVTALEGFTGNAADAFIDSIECDMQYNIESMIRERTRRIVDGLLSGDMEYIKDHSILSDYDYDLLRKIRLAIYEAAGDEVLRAGLADLTKKVNHLENNLRIAHSRIRELTTEKLIIDDFVTTA